MGSISFEIDLKKTYDNDISMTFLETRWMEMNLPIIIIRLIMVFSSSS